MNTNKQLITIVCESILEQPLTGELENLGVTGYTLWAAKGKGKRGQRGNWSDNANLQLQVVCSKNVAIKIMQHLKDLYFKDYAIIIYQSEVSVLRSHKF